MLGTSVKSRLGTREMVQDESGQSLIVVAFAIVALVAIIGLGVDLGLVYVERVRLARAMDAGALAAAQELPSEAAAHERALEYLRANGYDTGKACIETHGSTLGGAPGSCSGSTKETTIIIDTYTYRPGGKSENTATAIQVRGSQGVGLTFMRVIGFDTVPISASATAENIEDIDIVIVYDRSGSMQEDTRCYGCWEPDPTGEYPAGVSYPLPYTIVPTTGLASHCRPSEPLVKDGRYYLSIEAEHYSRYLREADYHRDATEYPRTWWSLQRQPNVNASGPDTRGAFMDVGPHSQNAIHYLTIDDIVFPSVLEVVTVTPRLDFDFTVPVAGTYYVWMRAQGGVGWSSWGNVQARRQVYVGLNGTPLATGTTPNPGPYGAELLSDGTVRIDGAASPDGWRWTRVLALPGLSVTSPVDPYTLNFWAAGPGFSLDKIVITNNPDPGLASRYPLNLNYNGIPGGGPFETGGRTDWACMGEFDPRFGPFDPLTGVLDDLYDDYQPIRAAKEAAKKFVKRLNPELDQVGYVEYSTRAGIVEELYCLKRVGSCTKVEFQGVITEAIESSVAAGGTNIADAIWDGLRVLSLGEEGLAGGGGGDVPPKSSGTMHYGRPNAAHIMVLLTDGQANLYPGQIRRGRLISPPLPSGYGDCFSDDLWPDEPGEDPDQIKARECVIWFANQARDQGVVIYTVGLGAQVDSAILKEVADITGGWYFEAVTAEQLDYFFEQLYERIFLRLID